MKTLIDITHEYNLRNDTHYEFGTDKEYNHRYISLFYEKRFKEYQNKEISLLEIGIHRGGSLALWYHYFPHAKIIGVDPYDFGSRQNIQSRGMDDRVQVIYADGYNKEFADSLPNFDIIIDDGPHTKESHISFLELYLPKLNIGGTLVIEDISDINWCDAYEPLIPLTMPYKVEDLREESGVHDSIIFTVRKTNDDPWIF